MYMYSYLSENMLFDFWFWFFGFFLQTLKSKNEEPQVNMLNNESNNLPDFKQPQDPGDIDSNTLRNIHYSRRRRSVPQGKSGGGTSVKEWTSLDLHCRVAWAPFCIKTYMTYNQIMFHSYRIQKF